MHFREGSWYLDSIWSILNMIVGCIVACVLLVILIQMFLVPKQINQFNLYQELVEISYSEEETELNYAMNIQVIGMNKWLASARASEETYGIFSFYKGKLDNLEYIEIGD